MRYIQISSFSDTGIVGKEKVVFRATGMDNIGRYTVFHTNETEPGKVNSKPRHVYWFPDEEVKSGDFIILYTCNGTNNSYKNGFGTMTHVFYWGCTTTLFNTSQDSVALLCIDSWDYKARG